MKNSNRVKRKASLRRKVVTLAVASCFATELAHANPTGPAVISGQVSMTTNGNLLQITNSPGSIINWQGFSIGASEITRFLQQSASSTVLNRVVGANPSVILGALQSNGRVLLINGNGIVFGAGSTIDTAGLVGSTLKLSDADFLAGRMKFTDGAGAGNIANDGKIATATGGFVYLVAPNIQNSGIIRSDGGEIILAAGKSVDIVNPNSPDVRITVTAPDGQALNVGQIIASKIGVYGALIKQAGVVNANTAVRGENGKIVFKATKDVTLAAGSSTTANGPTGGSITIQSDSGKATVAGAVEANGTQGKGGTVSIAAPQGVSVEATGRVSANGTEGGSVGLASSAGSVAVAGTITANATAGRAGEIALTAATSAGLGNGGLVSASGGLGGGSVSIKGSNNVTLETGSRVAVTGANGGAVSVQADQGTVLAQGTIDATAADGIGGSVQIAARSDITLDDASQILFGGRIGGEAKIESREGTLLASGLIDGQGSGGPGGLVWLLAPRVGLVREGSVNVSGLTGGGTVLVGGDYHGGNPDVQNALQAYVGVNATIAADALSSGNGGKVVVWADDTTQYRGSITARGAGAGGNGGFAEVSGKGVLDFRGLVNLTAPSGVTGVLLLDPRDLNIVTTSDNQLSGTGTEGNPWVSAGGASRLTPATLQTQLGLSSVLIQTGGTGGAAGDITITNTVTAPANSNSLTLQAHNDIILDTAGVALNFSASSGKVILMADAVSADGAGAIINNTGTASITMGTGALVLTAGSGIGTVGAQILTTGLSTLAATTGTGGIFVRNSGSGNITVGSVTYATLAPVGGTVTGVTTTSANNSGNISIDNQFATGTITVSSPVSTIASATGATGGITLNTASGNIAVNAAVTTGNSSTPNGTNAQSGAIAVTAGGSGTIFGTGSLNEGSATVAAGAGADTATVGNITLNAAKVSRSSGAAATDQFALGFGAASGATTSNTAGSLIATTTGAAGNAGGLFVTGAAPLTLGALTTSGGNINIASTGAGTLSAGGAIGTSGGAVTLSSQDALNINANINAGAGLVTMSANQDGAGAQSFVMGTATSITTTNATANAVAINVNTAVGGTGGAVVEGITVGNGGTIAAQTYWSYSADWGNITAASAANSLNAGALGQVNLLAGGSAVGNNIGTPGGQAINITSGKLIVSGSRFNIADTIALTDLTVQTWANGGAASNRVITAPNLSFQMSDSAGTITIGQVQQSVGNLNFTYTGVAAPLVLADGAISLGAGNLSMAVNGTVNDTSAATAITTTGNVDIDSSGSAGSPPYGIGTASALNMNVGGTLAMRVSSGVAGVINVSNAGATNLIEATTTNSAITLASTGALNINGNIAAGNAAVTLNAGAGVTEGVGFITANGLQLTGAGTFTLTNASNNISTLAANVTGAVNYTDTNGFAVGTVATSGLVSAGGAVQLTTAGGTITSSQAINSSSTTAAGGNVTLTVSGAGNGVNLASGIVATGGNTTNSATFKGGDVLVSVVDGAITTATINTTGGTATAGGAAPVTGGLGGNVTLQVTAASTPRLITAGNITAKGGAGNATVTGAAGGIGGAGGAVLINTTGGSGGSISVAAIDTTGGVGGAGAAAAATDNGGKGGNAGTITLTAAGAAQSVTSSALIAAGGGQGGQAGGAGATSGNGGDGNTISITSNGATLDGVTALGGLAGAANGGTAGTASTVGGAITVNAGTGALALNNDVTTSANVSLTGTGVTLAAAKTVNPTTGTILINASGGTANFNATSSLTTANATGSAVIIRNASSLSLGNVNAVAAGAVLALGSGGAITGAITQNGASVLNVDTLTVNQSGGAVTLGNNNTIANLGAVTRGGAFTLVDTTGGLNLTGALTTGTTGNAVSITTAGAAPLALGSNSITGNQVSLTGRGVTQTGGTVDAGAGTITVIGSDGTAGAINMAGTLTTSGAVAVTIQNATTVALPNVTATAGTLVIGVGQDVTGAVTQTATDVLNVSTVTASTANSIDLSTGAGANTIANLGAITRGGALTVNDTTGGLNITGAITGGTTSNAVSITTAGAAPLALGSNNITGNQVSLTGRGVTQTGGTVDAGAGTITVVGSDGTQGAISMAGTLTTTNNTSAVVIRNATTVALPNVTATLGTLSIGIGQDVTGAVSQTATRVLNVDTISASTAGSIDLITGAGANTITNLGPITRGGALTINDTAGGLVIGGAITGGTISNPVSIATAGGALVINAGSNISSTGANAVSLTGVGVTNGATVTGEGGISIDAGTGTFNNTAGTLTKGAAAGAPITLIADSLSIGGGTINAGTGAVTLTPGTITANIEVCNANCAIGGTTDYDFAGVASITAGSFIIGRSTHTGTISMQGLGAGFPTFPLTLRNANTTVGAITVLGAFQGGAGASLTLDNLGVGGIVNINAGANITAPAGFSVTGNANLGANVTTTNTPITFGGNVVLAEATSSILNSGGGLITITGTTDGTAAGAAENLTLNSGSTGAMSFAGAFGSIAPLGTLTIANSNGTTFQSTVDAATIALTDTAVGQTIAFQGNTNATTALTVGAGTAAYNVSFRGSSNTIAGATTFNNTGTLTLGNGGDVTAFTGGVVATAPSLRTLGGTVSAAGTGVINLGGSVSVANSSTVGGASTGLITVGNATLADGVTLTLGAGAATPINAGSISGTAAGAASNVTINTTGAVTVAGAVGTDIGTLTITNSGGTTFQSTVNAATIAITDTVATQTVAFQGNTTATTGMTVGAGTGAYNVSFTGGSNTIAGATTFNNTSTLTLGDGGDTTAFTGGVVATAPSSKTINGTVSAAGTGVINLGTTGVSVAGNSTVGGTSTGLITLGNATLADGVTLTLGAGAATPINAGSISGTAAGAASNVTINTTGAVTVAGAVGTDIGTLTVTQSGGATFQSTVDAATIALTDTTVGQTIAFQGNTNATTALTVGAGTAAYNVSFTGANNTIAGATTFNNTGTLSLGDGGDVTAFTGGVVATAPSSKTINGTVSAAGTGVINLGTTGVSVAGNSTVGGASTGLITVGNATLADGVTLTLGTGIATPINAGSISGTAAGAASNVTIDTTGAVTVSGAVGTDIGTLTITNSGGTTFQNTVNAATIAITDTVATQTVAFQGNTNATTALTVGAGSGAYNVSFTGGSNTIAGATTFNNTGTLNLGNGGGDTFTFTGGVNTTPVSGTVTLNSTINTTNAALNLGAVTLGGTTILSAGNGQIDVGVVTGGGQSLAANTTGATNFNGAISGVNALTTNALGTTTVANTISATSVNFADNVNLNGASVTTTANQNYTTATLGTNVTLNSGVGNITTTGAISGGGTRDLTIQGSGTNSINSTSAINTLALNQTGGSVTFTGNLDAATLTTAANNFNIALQGTTNTVTGGTLTTLSNTGTLTLGNSGDTSTFNGGLTAITQSLVDIGGAVNATVAGRAVTLGATRLTSGTPSSISTSNGNINFNTTLTGTTGGAENLTLTAGTGDITFSGIVGATRLGAVQVVSAKDVNVNAGFTAASLVQSAGNGAGTTTIGGAVDTNTATGVSLTTAGAITQNNTITTTTGASGGGVAFSNGGLLTINGNITSDGNVTQVGGGNVTITAPRTITTTGDLVSFTNNVALNGGAGGLVSIDTTAGGNTGGNNITFTGTLNAATAGANAEDLTLNAGTGGDVLFSSAVGGGLRMGDMNVTNARNVTENGIIARSLTQVGGNAAGTTLLTGAIDTNTATGVSLTTAGAITVNNTITTTSGASGGGVAFSNGGLLTINGNITSDGNVTQVGVGNVTITAPRTITTTGDAVSFANNVTLNGGAAGLVSINTTSGVVAGNNITFSSTLNATTPAANQEKLTLNAGTGGDITFTGAVGATRVGDVIVTNAHDVNINSTFAAASLLQSAGTGTTTTLAGNVNTNNSQAGDGVQLTTNNIAIGSGGVITTGTGNVGQQLYDHAGVLAISGNISSNDSFHEQSTAGTGAVTFSGTRTITTTGSNRQVRIEKAVTLLNPSSLSIDTLAGGGGNVRFDSTINGTTAGGQNLTINAGTGGNVRFDSALGGGTRLGAVTITNAQDVTESLGVTAASFVQSAGNAAGTTLLSGAVNTNAALGVSITTGGVITQNNTITTAGAGTVAFSNGGLLTINGDITSDGAVTQVGGGNVTITAPRTITTTADLVSFTNNVTINGGGANLLTINTTSGSAAGANITFSGLLDANSSSGNAEKLTLNAGTGGDVLFTGAVGGTQRLGDLVISNARNVTESAGIIAHSLTQTAGSAGGTTLLTGAVNTDTATGVNLTTAGAITANNTITTTTGGGVTFSNGGLLTINGDITSDGAVAQSGGGNVTITAPRTITTTGDAVSFVNNVTLNGGAAGLVSINTTSGVAAGNNITFSGTLNATTAAANEEKLTLNAGTGGNITFTGAVGTTRLGDVVITNAHDVNVNNTFASASLLQSAGNGTTATSTGNLNTDNSQAGNGVQLTSNNVTVGTGGITTTNGGIVTINNAGTLTVNGQINAAGNVLQNGAGITLLNADIITNRALVQFTQGVVLVGANRLIDTTTAGGAGGTIQFDKTINGSGFKLTLAAPTATGDIILNGAASNLSGFVVNSGRNLTIAPTGSITTAVAGTGIDIMVGGTLTNSAGGSLGNSGGSSAINLTADKMLLAGSIAAGSGPVKVTSFTAGNTIDLGSATDAAANTLELSNAEVNTITTTGTLTIGSTPTVVNHTGTIVASTGNNVTFTNPSGLVVLQTSGGNVNINSVVTKGANGLNIDTTGGAATTGGIFDPNGTGMLVLTAGGNLNLVSGAGVGTTAKPVHTNTSSLTLNNSTSSDVYIQNTGTLSLATTFRNQVAGGKLWLETLNGAINTGAVVVSTNNGQMILTASDTSGAAGNNAQINVGSGGLTSSGGMIALHGADVVTIQSGAGISTSGGNVEIISGTGAGINNAAITRPASEVTADDFGAIYIGAPIATGAGNTLLVASTTATASIITGVVQGVSSGTITGTSPVVSSLNPTTGAAVGTTGPISTNILTVVTLRGAGGAGNGGAAIDLQNAANTSGTINLFACPVIGCPDTALPGGTRTTGPFVTAPMIINTNAPNAVVTPGKYGDGPIFYVDTGGTNVSGIGTVNDFTFYTPGNVTITTVQQARNLKLEASGNIDLSLTTPVDNTVILKNGSLQLVAGNNINYNPTTAGNTFGSAVATFNRDLKFTAAGSIDVNNAIYQGNDVTVPASPVVTTLSIKANQDVSMNNGTVNITRKNPTYNTGSGIGDVVFRGNHEVSNLGGMTVEGVNIKALGGSLGSANQSTVGELIKSAGTINFNATFTPSAPPAKTGDIVVTAGTAVPGTSDSAAIVNGTAAVNIGSAGVRSNNLILTGGSNTASGAGSHSSDASILSAGQINILLKGNATLTGGAATTASTGSNETATALATINGGNVVFDAIGNVTIKAGTAIADGGLAVASANFSADASASMISGGAFAPKIGGTLTVAGNSSSATASLIGQTVRAKAQGIMEGRSLDITVGVDLLQDNTTASATATTSGGASAAVASSSSVLSGHGGDKVLKVAGKWDMLGGAATANGGGANSDTLIAVIDSDNSFGANWKLTATAGGNIDLTAGTEAGTNKSGASSAVIMGAPGNITLHTANLVLTGNSSSGLFNQLPGNTVIRLDGTHIPITVNGSGSGITIVYDATRGGTVILSGAPPTNLDTLQATIISALQSSSTSRSSTADSDVNAAKNKPVDGSKICK